MRNKLVLANEDVQRLVAACKAETARNKCAATIAVVDESANLLYLERMDGPGGEVVGERTFWPHPLQVIGDCVRFVRSDRNRKVALLCGVPQEQHVGSRDHLDAYPVDNRAAKVHRPMIPCRRRQGMPAPAQRGEPVADSGWVMDSA